MSDRDAEREALKALLAELIEHDGPLDPAAVERAERMLRGDDDPNGAAAGDSSVEPSGQQLGTWHYAITREAGAGGTDWYTIREVHHDADGRFDCTEEPNAAGGESVAEVEAELERMLADARRYAVLDLTGDKPRWVGQSGPVSPGDGDDASPVTWIAEDWLAGPGLQDLMVAWESACRLWEPPVALDWLQSPCEHLNGRVPVRVLVYGGLDEVLAALDAIEQGGMG